jgi:hypothetical protein
MGLFGTIQFYLDTLFHSKRFNIFINVLVIINFILVITDLTLEYVELSLIDREFKRFQFELRKSLENDEIEAILKFKFSDTKTYSDVRKIFRIILISISGFFIFEQLTKLIFLPKIFIHNKLEILDAIFVMISFVSALFVLVNSRDLLSVVTLLTLIRLWRLSVLFKRNFEFFLN